MAVVLKLLLATLSHSLHYDRLLTATIIHANNDVLICGPNSSFFFFRFLFHGVHYWCIPSSNISWCSQMLFCECSWRIQAREFQLGLLPPGTGEGGLRAGVV